MNDTSPRCAGPGSACRLLQLEAPGARPVWAVLDAAGMRRFTGELTLSSRPVVRVYFNDGEVYYAERDGDPTITDRLVEYGVATVEQLAAGTVQLGAVAHLGRLFDRVPSLQRDPVELVLEVVTAEVLGEIADHTVEHVSIASYRHHSSGVSKWRRRPAAATDAFDTSVTNQAPTIAPAAHPGDESMDAIAVTAVAVDDSDPAPTAEDHQLVADYEQLMSAAAQEHSIVHERPEAEGVAELETIVEAVIVAERFGDTEDVAEAAQRETLDEAPQPFSFEFDLNKVLAQVALENDGLPIPMDSDEIDEDVRAAVREALAEITAATRPPITDGLSPTAFEIALASAPESAADIEPATTQSPWLSASESQAPTTPLSGDDDTDDTVNDDADVNATGIEATPPAAPSGSLRRLIGGGRKP